MKRLRAVPPKDIRPLRTSIGRPIGGQRSLSMSLCEQPLNIGHSHSHRCSQPH